MKYFCEVETNDNFYFFTSNSKPENPKIKCYEIEGDDLKISELNNNISIINSKPYLSNNLNLLSIYMLLSEICIKETAKEYFNKKASVLALKEVNIFNHDKTCTVNQY